MFSKIKSRKKINRYKNFRAIAVCFFCVFTFLIGASLYVHADDLVVNVKVPLSDFYKSGIQNNSIISASPNVVLVNNEINVNIQILDYNKSPLQYHSVLIGVIGVNGVTLNQISTITNANGFVYATLSSTIPGNFEIYAIDQTYKQSDNAEILLAHDAFVTFTTDILTQVTPIPTAVIKPTAIPRIYTTPTPTPTAVFTPVITTTLTPTIVTITPTPAVVQIVNNPSIFDILSRILGFNICSNNTAFYGMLALILLFVFIIIKVTEDKNRLAENLFIYTLIVILTVFLLKIVCFSWIITTLIWLLLTIIGIEPLRKYITKHILKK